MSDVQPKKRGRPPKIKPMAGETPATQVAPAPEVSTNPVPLNAVEELDPITDEVIARHEDDGVEIELPSAFGSPPFGDAGLGVLGEVLSVARPKELSPAQVAALDRDFNGEAGGSWPIAELTELQTKAYAQNLINAHEGQFEIKVTDGFNRIWSFRHEIVKSHLHALVECKRGPKVSRQFLLVSALNLYKAEEMVRACDAETRR